jgi:N-acyl homoserine lactone hydrolase
LNWKIDCLCFGKMECLKCESTPELDKSLRLWLPILGFLLRDGKRNILVDTGVNNRHIKSGTIWEGVQIQAGEESVLSALKKVAVDPKEIDTVVYTHFHDDHVGNSHLFPKAKHISQRDEWRELLDHLPHGRYTYDPIIIQEIKKLNNLMVTGNFQLAPGIMCYQVPGHSLGCMAMTVNTTSGMYVISSDLVILKCNLYPQMDTMLDIDGKTIKITPAPIDIGPAIPPFVTHDYYSWLNSVSLLKAMCSGPEYLLTSHDPSLVNKSYS